MKKKGKWCFVFINIIQGSKMEDIKVTVLCITYNHGRYIRDALNGFIKQKTQFKYEVIVHDDASTDNTKDIILEFANKYPDIIKPIIQESNQYSKGIRILQKYLWNQIKGEYVAVCEGDDFWISEDKLQRQVDFLDNNHEYVACVHNTLCHNMDTDKDHYMYGKKDHDISIEDAISAGGASYHTSSLMCKSEIYTNRPDWTSMIPGVGDYPVAIHITLSGKVRYIGDVFSYYRLGVPESWTKRVRSNAKINIRTKQQINEMLNVINVSTNYIFSKEIEKAIHKNDYDIFELKGDYAQLKSDRFSDLYCSESVFRKIFLYIKFQHSKIYNVLLRMLQK